MRKAILLSVLLLVSLSVWGQQKYFEAPRLFTDANTRFPQLVSNRSFGVAAYQRINGAATGGTIDVIIQTTDGGRSWSAPSVAAKGIRYEGTVVPPVYSVAVDAAGTIGIATVDYDARTGENGTTIVAILLSTDGGATFHTVHTVSGDISLVSPRLFPGATGGWYLTMERFDQPSNRVVYTHSDDAQTWSELLAIPADVLQTGTQSDVTHLAIGNRDLFMFVGENILPPTVPAGQPDIAVIPQVYAIYTDDGGATWAATDPASGEDSTAVPGVSLDSSVDLVSLEEQGGLVPYTHMRILSEALPDLGVLAPQDLVMRRPALTGDGSTRVVAFEAGLRLATDNVRQVAVAQVDENGNIIGVPDVVSADSLRRSDARTPYDQPMPVIINGTIYVIAYQDPARGGAISLYDGSGGSFHSVSIDSIGGVATYPAAASIGGRAHFFWHRRTSNNNDLPTRVVYLEPDQRANPPIARGVNFDIGHRSRDSQADFAWTPAPDASGIVAYAYAWTRDPNEPVPIPASPATNTSASFPADEDGPWYLRIRALDRAGNWSTEGTAEFYRDTTPPGRVTFIPPKLDEDGFLVSNTFSLRWEPPTDDLIGGYYAELTYVASETADVDISQLPFIEPAHTNEIPDPVVSRTNYDNGLWALSVAAVDSVGNVGEASVLYVRMNKYIPVTEIATITAIPDPLGRYNLRIVGRGFTANGRIVRVILDRDGKPPYDYVFDSSSPGFRIYDDRSMAGPVLDDLSTGDYYVGLDHSERGIMFSASLLKIERNGTVKFGDYAVRPGMAFTPQLERISLLDSTTAITWIVVLLMLAVAVFSGGRLVTVAREGVHLRLEARALVAGKPGLIAEREERVAQMRRQGLGLRVKFAFFIVLVVMAVVAMVAVGLGTATLKSQQLVLQRALKERVDVLMGSMVTSSEDALLTPDAETLALGDVPASVGDMDEALYATVTGPKSTLLSDDLPAGFNYVWGTNDPVLEAVGETNSDKRNELLGSRAAAGAERKTVQQSSQLDIGRSRLDDAVSEKTAVLETLIDRLGTARLNKIVREREVAFAKSDALRRQINAAAAAGSDTTELSSERQQAQLLVSSLNNQITSGVEQVVLDASNLIRLAEFDAGPGGEAAAVYQVPDSMTQIESDIERASTVLPTSNIFSGVVSSPVLSYPPFVPSEYDPNLRDYLFYEGIANPDTSALGSLSQDALEKADPQDLTGLTYARGTIRLGVATDIIVDQITQARTDIIRITVLIALAAIIAGVAGAIILATIVVRPINRIVRGVEEIRRTQDKSLLKDHTIEVRTRDELYRLADSINTMTVALAAAAEAEKALIVTSDLQKKFIPLDSVTEEGKARKLTMAHLDIDGAEFHGYYEGADALSGDYFTYEWLDKPESQGGTEFVLMKCDVSGHGVNAAFIMVEVATIFLNRVRDWRDARTKPNLVGFVSLVNDMLVDRGFESLFAAMTVAVVDTKTGKIRMTHGGDTEQRFYRSATRKVEEHKLDQAPATGMFDQFLFPPGVEYKEFAFSIGQGDIMIMATDGVEESAREIRNADFEPVPFNEEEFAALEAEAEKLDPPAKVDVDKNTRIAKEEFSTERMVQIIENVQSQGSFRLERLRNYDPNEDLVFDYHGLAPSAQNTVVAVMAAEKIFRLIPDLSADEPIRVDRELDDFLRDHFNAYRRYFAYRVPDEQRPDASMKFPRSEYVYYTHLREEVQGDDLTILAVRKK